MAELAQAFKFLHFRLDSGAAGFTDIRVIWVLTDRVVVFVDFGNILEIPANFTPNLHCPPSSIKHRAYRVTLIYPI